MARGDITVNVRGEYDDRDIDRAIKDLKRLGNVADKETKGIGGLGIRGAAIGSGLAMAGAAALNFGKDAVAAAGESQQADARLNAIANSMGYAEGAYAGGVARLQEYATALQRSIAVEDEQVQVVQAKLLTFKAVGDTMNVAGGAMDRATIAAFNLASAGFGTAEGNATQLGKALQDPIKGLASLARSGVTFTADQKALIQGFVEAGDVASAQNLILQAVETQVGGTAEATVTAGQRMSTAFGQLQEDIGLAIMPALESLTAALLPVLDSVKQPIADIASAFGTTLAAVFEALAPVLPPLAAALTTIAGVLANVLLTAVNALMPVITPLLNLMADLATRLAPLLGPLLTKIGEALTAVMNAVVPLLEPLTNFIFQLLEPLMPIIDVILDVFIQIVNQALAPLLNVVGLLLAPLGTLINVLLAAILPIIQPLVPIFAGLASVLGGVVVGSIGLLMVAFGNMLKGVVGAAPTIINNFIKPVAEAFLSWAETIVNAANFAFSWVPGIGDLIKQAAAYMPQLRSTILNGINSIGAQASSAGAAIANQLISGGQAALASAGSLMAQSGQQFMSAFGGGGGSNQGSGALESGRRPAASTSMSPRGLAGGGPANYGNGFLVGERGPELFIPDVSGTIIPNNQLMGAGRGGNSYSITVQAGVGDPREIGRQVVDVIKKFEKVSGPVFAVA